jgi:hypothetical protein
LIGDSGTGKSHPLIALSTEAAMHGFRVKYTLATKLVNELVEAADDKVLTKTVARSDMDTIPKTNCGPHKSCTAYRASTPGARRHHRRSSNPQTWQPS